MPALSFKSQFAPLIESGQKRQTIRSWRKIPINVGDTLYLYTGMRTKSCRKLTEVECREVWCIRIFGTLRIVIVDRKERQGGIWEDRVIISDPAELLEFAKADGFATTDDFFGWFSPPSNPSFAGQLIKW